MVEEYLQIWNLQELITYLTISKIFEPAGAVGAETV